MVICLSQRFTSASSNVVRSEVWSLMKSCNSVIRCSCSSRCTVSIEACCRFSLRSNTALALMQTSSESGKSLEPEGDKNQAGQELGRPLVGRIYNGSLLEYVKKTVEQNNH